MLLADHETPFAHPRRGRARKGREARARASLRSGRDALEQCGGVLAGAISRSAEGGHVNIARAVMQSFYRKAEGRAERLPWHRESPSHVLESAVTACTRPARALDLGCGAGVLTLWLAHKGLEVTGIDVLPEAIAMARSLADERRAGGDFL